VITLGIESSCDEMSAAVLVDGHVQSNVIASQLAHTSFGGVVPELASREHTRTVVPVVLEAFQQAGIDAGSVNLCAATQGPGLIGSLLVGLNFAKAFSLARGIPFMPVDHIEAHVFSSFLGEEKPEFPFLVLVVSGGHTQLYRVDSANERILLGTTIDDAAGEAFDKVAKMLGLAYPGGPSIERLALSGDPYAIRFPRPMIDSGDFNFSFSGLKTSVLYHMRKAGAGPAPLSEKQRCDIAASFQEAVVDVLASKAFQAIERYRIRHFAVTGGVSANSALRSRMAERAQKAGVKLHVPDIGFSTDNAAMVGLIGEIKFKLGGRTSYHAQAYSRIQAIQA
jgi:N6-L-threonylcarbamoyladenine synthase